VAAAPHLFDDPIASPELALVDADLAAQLRADLATGESFRPRDVPRAEPPRLVFDAVVRDLPVEEPDVAVDDALQVEDEAEPVDELVPDDEPLAPPVLEAFPLPEEQAFELPEYLVAGDDEVVGDEPRESDLGEAQPAELSEDVLPDDALAPPVLEALPLPEEQTFELPEYLVAGDDVVRDEPRESDLAEVEPAELSEDLLPDDEPLSFSALEELALPAGDVVELPDYAVESVEGAGDRVDELPDYVVRPEVEPAPALPEYIVAPAEAPSLEDDVADIVLDSDVILPEVVEASTDHAATRSDYPVLPDLEERSDALEETEAALRRIREQFVPPGESKRRPRLRRRFTVVAALCVMAAAGMAAADVQLGLAHGLLGF